MQIIRHFIGAYADQRRFDDVDGAMKVIKRHRSEGLAEHATRQRIPIQPERPTAPDDVSQSRDWLSWMPSETASPIGVP